MSKWDALRAMTWGMFSQRRRGAGAMLGFFDRINRIDRISPSGHNMALWQNVGEPVCPPV